MVEHTNQAKLADVIRAHRIDLGVSQEAFADHIEMHRAYYSKIERGEKNLTLATLERVAKGMGTSMSALLRAAGQPARLPGPRAGGAGGVDRSCADRRGTV